MADIDTNPFRFEISHEDLIATYLKGEEHIETHRNFYENLIKQGLGPAEFAKSLGYTRGGMPYEYNNSYHQAKRWLNGTSPFPIRAVSDLHKVGLFPGKNDYIVNDGEKLNLDLLEPFGIDNKFFDLISLLSSILYWSGNMGYSTPDVNDTTVESHILGGQHTENQIRQLKSLTDKIKELNWSGNNKLSKKKGELHIRFKSYVGRLISLLIGFIGRKSRSELIFPNYVEASLEYLERYKRGKYIDVAYQILRDFIAILFTISGSETKGKRYLVTLTESSNQNIAFERQETYKRILKVTGLEPMLNSSFSISRVEEPEDYVRNIPMVRVDQIAIKRLNFEFYGRVQDVLLNLEE